MSWKEFEVPQHYRFLTFFITGMKANGANYSIVHPFEDVEFFASEIKQSGIYSFIMLSIKFKDKLSK